MESQLVSARILLIAAAVPAAVFLCLRATGVDVGFSIRDAPAATSSDTQVVADFGPFADPSTSADDLFDRRSRLRASVLLGGSGGNQDERPGTGADKPGGGQGSSQGSSGGSSDGSSGGSGGSNPGGTTGTSDPLQPIHDAVEPVVAATDPVVEDLNRTVEETVATLEGTLEETGLEVSSLP